MFCCNVSLAQTANANFTDGSNTTISTGNSSAVSGAGNEQSINFGGSQQAPLGMIAIPNHQAPSVFQFIPNNVGMTAEITGLPLEVFYDQKCQPEESEVGDAKVTSMKGYSELTRITITEHPEFKSFKKGDKPSKVRMDLSGGKKRYKCLGILTVVANKNALEKGQPVGFSVLASDIRKAVRAIFVGLNGNIVLLSGTNYWSGALGVSNDSSGLSFGASLANLVGKFSSVGVAPGISSGSGVSSPTAMSGLTALILLETDDENGIEISLAEIGNPFGDIQTSPVGSNGKKAEAEKLN